MPPPDSVVTKAYENPVVLYLLIGVLAIGLIITAGTKIGGAVGNTIRAWTAGRRRAETGETDADIQDLSRQVSYLRKELGVVRRYQQQHTIALVAHQAWDTNFIAAAARKGVTVTDPPPLWPPPADPILPTDPTEV